MRYSNRDLRTVPSENIQLENKTRTQCNCYANKLNHASVFPGTQTLSLSPLFSLSLSLLFLSFFSSHSTNFLRRITITTKYVRLTIGPESNLITFRESKFDPKSFSLSPEQTDTEPDDNFNLRPIQLIHSSRTEERLGKEIKR